MNKKDIEMLTEAYVETGREIRTLKDLLSDPDIQIFVKNPEEDISDAAYEKAYTYYLSNGEMPYGTAKARSGDPYMWVMDRLEQDWKSYIS